MSKTKPTNPTKCTFCGAELPPEEQYTLDDTVMCRSCYHAETAVCSDCGARVWREDTETRDSMTLCQSCMDDYNICASCGCFITEDDTYRYECDDAAYCSSCFEREDEDYDDDGVINEYSYKPIPIFYGDERLFMGVELEIDKGGGYGDDAQKLLDIANYRTEHLYCKHDGSLNNGFELVTHPMSLDYHRKEMPWPELLKKAAAMGYRSHQTSTCGLHIHVNRDFFGVTPEEQEVCIARAVHLVENCWNELLAFSRRTEHAMNQWAKRYGIADTVQNTYQGAKNKSLGRYVAVNLENDHTIEFRLFRGTLRYETFLATVELVDEICRTALRLNDKELERLSWSGFVSAVGADKPELIAYLKSKRLYVNEPAVEGVEV